MNVKTILGYAQPMRAPDGGGDGGAPAAAATAAAAGGGDGAAAAAAAPAAAAATGAGGAAAAPGNGGSWLDGLSDDHRAFVNTKGYKSAGDVINAYHNAEKAIGLDKVAIPKDDSPQEVKDAFWTKIGRPADAAGYAFTAPKDVADYDPAMSGWFGDVSLKANLTKSQANIVHDAFMGLVGKMQKDAGTALEARHTENTDVLRQKWGAKFDVNRELANKAIKHFGGDALVTKIGKAGLNSDPDFNAAFAAIGALMADDSAAGGGGTGGGYAMTPEEAMAEIKKLESGDDKSPLWNKTHGEHAAAVKRRSDLYAMAFPTKKAS